ncbi:transposase family protein [Streptomyces sp. NPDC127051]|uniref:transposase family protein n=1 Tax=Streptomyces sp. NPDC127051 TaxID=3347119 RepID=UPI003655C7B1
MRRRPAGSQLSGREVGTVQGRRYRLGALLALCTIAVLGGAATLVGMARFVAGAPPEIRARLGLGARIPRACTLGRVLARIDADALDRAVGTWLAGHLEPADGLRALAVDGKSLRGSRTIERTAVHLLAAVLHGEKAGSPSGRPVPRATRSPRSGPCPPRWSSRAPSSRSTRC